MASQFNLLLQSYDSTQYALIIKNGSTFKASFNIYRLLVEKHFQL